MNDKLKRVIELRRQKKALQETLNEVNAELRELEGAILEQWHEDGIDKITVNGATIYVSRQLSVRITDREKLVAALREHAPDLLTANNRSLASYCRELFEREDIGDWAIDPRRLPEGIAQSCDFDQYERLNVRGLG